MKATFNLFNCPLKFPIYVLSFTITRFCATLPPGAPFTQYNNLTSLEPSVLPLTIHPLLGFFGSDRSIEYRYRLFPLFPFNILSSSVSLSPLLLTSRALLSDSQAQSIRSNINSSFKTTTINMPVRWTPETDQIVSSNSPPHLTKICTRFTSTTIKSDGHQPPSSPAN